jgi:hypothetical protein
MANADNPIFSAQRGFDFQDPVLDYDLVEQLLVASPGVPEHHLHREQAAVAANVRRPHAQRPPVEHHVSQTSEAQPAA